jgi:transposase-like protein
LRQNWEASRGEDFWFIVVARSEDEAEIWAGKAPADQMLTDAVLNEIAEWQNRPLDISYPLVFFDALRVKIRDEGFVRNKAVYIALGVLPNGTKDILGLWIEQTEGAKCWLRVMNELKGRGVSDILIAVVDGLGDLAKPAAGRPPSARPG